MKFAKLSPIITIALFTVLVLPLHLGAQEHHANHHHYKLVDIGTFGGPDSSNAWAGMGNKTMNSGGAVLGEASTPASDPYCLVDCFLNDAFQWQNGVMTDLQGLPGNVNGTYADSINSRGSVSGISGNGTIDPLTGYPQMDAVLWKHGKITNLGTLGGNGSAAFGINNRSQVVGAALNTVLDSFSSGFPAPYCGGFLCIEETYAALFFPSATQTHAVLWQNGTIKDLGTLGGPDSVAWQVNERGQIAGQSYVNSTPNATTGVPTIDPFFIGEDGNMVDLGGLGGTVSWTSGLNNRGQVIGAMTVAGDGGWHPFLWSHGVLTDLGTLGVDCGFATAINDSGEVVGVACSPTTFFATVWRNGVLTNLGTIVGDTCSESYDINSQGQVVGESADCGGPNLGHAWLWENGGPMVDLNTLVPPGSGIQLTHSVSINDRGEISGDGVLPTGDHHAFVLVPCDENHPGVEGCDYSLVDATAASRENPVPVMQEPTTAALRRPALYGPFNNAGRMRRRLGPLSHMPTPITGSVDEQKARISRESNADLDDNVLLLDRAEPAADPSSKSSCDAAQSQQSCVPLGQPCYGPGPTHCCPAPFPHHSFCSSRTGWGRCYMN
jgi:probable HAF family extracellular repeat protein